MMLVNVSKVGSKSFRVKNGAISLVALFQCLPLHFFRAQQSASQPMVDYSYQDDYSMEDMTAPDTMINFSEMPQQPNYYQCPQTAHANQQLNIGFNMSLQHNSQPGYPSHPPTTQPVRPFLLPPKTCRIQSVCHSICHMSIIFCQ